MSLVGKTAGKGDLAQRIAGAKHQRLRTSHTPPDQKGMRGLPNAHLEGAAEMTGAKLRDLCQCVHSHRLRQSRFHMLADPTNLP